MKLKKVITIIIILIIVLNTLIPTIALATNETNNEVGTGTTNIDNTVNEKEENNNSIQTDDDNNKQENTSKNENVIENTTKENTTNNSNEISENTEIVNENEVVKQIEKDNIKSIDVKANEITANIAYNSHVQDYGWEEDFSKKDGEISGTTGASKRIEALKIELGSLKKTYPNTSIKYQVHVQDYDWMNWKKDGEVAGTIGESKRIEAIKIKLQGLDEYSAIYRVHVQDYGWTDWNSNGEIAGTIGKSKRIEAIQIKIIKGNYEKFKVSIKNENNNINEYYKNSIHYLFLSKNVSINNVVIKYAGNVIDTSYGILDSVNKTITGDFSKTESFTVKLETGETETVSIIQSNVPSLFINLNNDVTQDVLDSGSKDEKYKATLSAVGAEKKDYNISNYNITIKGRGNTTWAMPKKPYQIKFDKKINLLGTGTAKAKKWVLIANYTDPTLLKNKIVNDLCVNSELSNIPNSQFIDLYIDGNYVGNYLLCDKIEIGKRKSKLE